MRRWYGSSSSPRSWSCSEARTGGSRAGSTICSRASRSNRRARGLVSVEKLEHRLARTADQRAVTAEDDRSLHQLRVLEEHLDHRFSRLVRAFVEAELSEPFVLPDEVGRLIRDRVEDAFQIGSGRRLLQVLDHVELDAALAQQLDCAARLTSPRVEVHQQSFHPAEASVTTSVEGAMRCRPHSSQAPAEGSAKESRSASRRRATTSRSPRAPSTRARRVSTARLCRSRTRAPCPAASMAPRPRSSSGAKRRCRWRLT